jgi:CheY-like chemotaxis protein
VPAVRGDPTQLRQLVLNLITNAADAIGGDEGLIALRTQVVEVDRERLARTYVDDGLAGGRYVSLEVTDTGGGMSPRTVARIFDPFFTTKATGRGLGLSSVLGVVRGHRGAIEVRSQPAEGTTFEVFLPVATPAEASPAASATEGPAVACLGAVLLAEDEAIVRVVAQGGLEQVGFTTLVATDGGQAVQALEARGDDLVGVVLDVTMPVVSGTEIYRLIRRRWLEMPVLITSGFAEQEIEPLVRSGDPTAFVRKPYRPEQLVGRLQELIAVKGAPR